MENKGMDQVVYLIRKSIEKNIHVGKKKFIIYPLGDVGTRYKNILNDVYGIEEYMVIDNYISKFNANVKSIDVLDEGISEDTVIILASTNARVYVELKETLLEYVSENNIDDCFASICQIPHRHTKCGKYSYGPLTNHPLVEECGAFCSFALGTDVVANHPTSYISTHPMMYAEKDVNPTTYRHYEEECNEKWYFPGIKPHGVVQKRRRIYIGNDVWLGRNVIITNGANIGNGVIAAAGAVITKEVPDYAVVAGVPARIIRYRYTEEQIKELNKIAWWSWSDNEIRDRYEDLYLPVDDFIEKYRKRE